MTIEEQAKELRNQHWRVGSSTTYISKESALVEVDNRKKLLLAIYKELNDCITINQGIEVVERIGKENNELKTAIKNL